MKKIIYVFRYYQKMNRFTSAENPIHIGIHSFFVVTKIHSSVQTEGYEKPHLSESQHPCLQDIEHRKGGKNHISRLCRKNGSAHRLFTSSRYTASGVKPSKLYTWLTSRAVW